MILQCSSAWDHRPQRESFSKRELDMWNQDATTCLSSSTITIWEICFLALAITMGVFLYQQKSKNHY